ncbi:MAG: hypothetical protein ACHQHO_07975 [Solirubrobacterales bacterium]
MIRQACRVVSFVVLLALATAAVALATGPKKGATYSGTTAHGKEPITLKVSKSGRTVTVSVASAPLYCQGGGGPERQVTAPAPIANDGSFSGSINYEDIPTHKRTTKLYFAGRFSGKTVKGTARSLFGLSSLEALRNLHKCDGSTSFSAKTK